MLRGWKLVRAVVVVRVHRLRVVALHGSLQGGMRMVVVTHGSLVVVGIEVGAQERQPACFLKTKKYFQRMDSATVTVLKVAAAAKPRQCRQH